VSWSIDGAYARCDALAIEGLAHGFGLRSTKPPLNLAATLRQVHGGRVVQASATDPEGADADGVWERLDSLNGRGLAVRTADCVPILLATRDGSLVAAVHAGWRGTAGSIVRRAVDSLAAAGAGPATLVAAIGPSIGPCCYPVSVEVAAELTAVSGITVDPAAADLREVNRSQLLAAGMPAKSIHSAPWCTSCEAGLFHSHRRDGAAAGRQWSLIGPPTALP
jgi:YfiH family protein